MFADVPEPGTGRFTVQHEPKGVGMGFMSEAEIQRVSVKRIVNPTAFDALGQPVPGGLYDLALGPTSRDHGSCPTCGLTSTQCPGHLGRVELSVPVFHPILFPNLYRLLKMICYKCHHFRHGRITTRTVKIKLLLLEADMLSEALELDDACNSAAGLFTKAGRPHERQNAIDEVLSRYEAMANERHNKLARDGAGLRGYDKRSAPTPPVQMCQHARAEWKNVVRHFFAKTPNRCEHCKAASSTLRKSGYSKIFVRHRVAVIGQADEDMDASAGGMDMIDDDGERNGSESRDAREGREVFLHPLEARALLSRVWRRETGIVSRIWNRRQGEESVNGYMIFFMQTLPIPASRFRPPAMLNGMAFDHPKNTVISKILGFDNDLRAIFAENGTTKNTSKERKSDSDDSGTDSGDSDADDEHFREKLESETMEKALGIWVEMQEQVNAFLDATKSRTAPPDFKGVRQGLEKKQGLFRQNMMGKRVNYAARSVISPDPYIDTNEVGLPVRFAKKLSFPEPVTPFNAEELAAMVRNGPDVHPGALFVEDQDGRLIDLGKRSKRQREDLAEQIANQHKLTLSDAQSVQATKFMPGNEDGLFKREHNKAHAALSLRKQQKVWRHARSGDVMLANRQPTLHKPSLMAHKVRVINNMSMQTIRLHYANCNSYNADFDGDEINLHLPQSELCRAEAYEIAFTDHQYCSTTNGEPLRGLIQDHVGMGVMLTKQDTFLTKAEYTQMVFTACSAMNRQSSQLPLLPPAIFLPQRLWTGKQVITTIIMHLVGSQDPTELVTMGPGKTKIPANAWKSNTEPKEMTPSLERALELIGPDDGPLSQTQVVVRQGHLCTGVLDKAQFGASQYGLVHCVYELYGANAAGELLSAFGRLFTFCAQKWGHTCAIEDLLLNREAEAFRTASINASVAKGVALSAEFAGLEGSEHSNEDVAMALERRIRVVGSKDDEAILDSAMQGVTSAVTSDIIRECLPKGQRKPFPSNCFSLMVYSGAKGSLVNHSQVSCGLGQQALEGRRVPRSVAGKSLPCFSPFDPTPRAGGFVSDRFLTGVRPQEYYFHCMAGREGLIDTAVKTANSGYLQRCLVKHLENISVGYDRTVRQSDGAVLQFSYGGDGLDALNTGFLKGSDNTLGFLYSNVPALVKRLHVGSGPGQFDISGETNSNVDMKAAHQLHKLIKKSRAKSAKLGNGQFALFSGCKVIARRPKRPDATPQDMHAETVLRAGLFSATVLKTHREDASVDLRFDSDGAVFQHVPIQGNRTQFVFGVEPDPVLSSLSPDSNLGAVNEALQAKLDDYIARNPHNLLETEDDELSLQQLVWIKYMRSLANPGENVGVIAAQGIGEPSTQMTLNTFHLAGHGAGNVTLGIPRLRELLMTASDQIKTPTMTLPILPTRSMADAEKLKSSMYCLKLDELLRVRTGAIKVTETLRRRSHLSGRFQTREEAAAAANDGHGGGEWLREYNIALVLQPLAVIEAEFGLTLKEVSEAVATKFCPLLVKQLQSEIRSSTGKVLRKVGNTAAQEDADEETSGSKSRAGKTDDEDEEDELAEEREVELAGGAENNTLKLGRKQEVDGYDEDSDADSDGDDVAIGDGPSALGFGLDDDEEADAIAMQIAGHGGSRTIGDRRVTALRVPTTCTVITSWAGASYTSEGKDFVNEPATVNIRFRFPASEKKLLMVGIASGVASSTIIRSVKDISASYVVETKGSNKELTVQTEGCNFAAAWELGDLIDVNRIKSNDVSSILRHYGVEAARAAIVEQVASVFGVYGIGVDPRHLNLVADYMTYKGDYAALNRGGMESVTSPFVRITFETSATFLTNAALTGEVDNLKSVSSRLVVGQLMRSGTGAFDVMVPNSVKEPARPGEVKASRDFAVGSSTAKKEKKEKKEKKSKRKHSIG